MVKKLLLSFLLVLFLVNYSSALEISPETLSFGYVQVGASKAMNITVKNTTGGNINLTITSNNPAFTVLPSNVNLVNNQEITITVIFSPTETKTYNALLIFTAGTNIKTVSATGNSISQPKISISPSSVDFGNVNVGQRKTVELKITNSGDVEIKNLRISSSSGEFTVNPESISSILPTNSATVLVTFVPTTQGVFSGELYIASDEIYTFVSLKGTAPYTTGLTVSSLSIDFGIVPIGSSKTETVVIENKGTGTISGNLIVPSNMGISVSSNNFNLQPGQKVNINITFSPQSAGSYRGTIGIVSNDKNSPRIDISFKAETSSVADYIKSIPDVLSFGYVKVGTATEKYMRIVNNTSTLLNVTATLSGDSVFQLDSKNITLAPNETKFLLVKFAPTDKKYYQSTVTLSVAGKTYYISATGYGDDGSIGAVESTPPVTSTNSGGGGGGCAIIGKPEQKNTGFGNLLVMALFPVYLLFRRLCCKIQ